MRRNKLLLFSANTPESLQAVADQHLKYLQESVDRLEDLEYTLAHRREHFKYRGFCLTSGQSPFEVVRPFAKSSPQCNGKVAFVFTGQGAQWVFMGRELLREHPKFKESIGAMDAVLRSLEHAPSWTIEDTMTNCEDAAILMQAERSQPICTALQIALVDLFADWGVSPSAVIGHSSGEIAAAYAAGALSRKEAIIVAFYRGYFSHKIQRRGGMAAVGMAELDVRPYLRPGVEVACVNSGKSVTLSGNADTLDVCLDAIKKLHPDVLVRKLQVSIAYHSRKLVKPPFSRGGK